VDGKRTVLFVCPHGAAKSRIAAAFFNRAAPAGWHAISAGVTPQESVGLNAVRLLAGTDAETLLDLDPPRPVSAAPSPARIVAIDCDVPGGARWDLAHKEFASPMRDELRRRAEALARELGDG
jgi:hypothetical protein